MYGIIEDLERLLAAKEFWYTLIGANILFVVSQPVPVGLTIIGVLLLYFIVWLGKQLKNGGLLNLFLLVVFSFLFLFTTMFITAIIEPGPRRPSDGNLLTAAIVNCLLWGIPILAYRRWKRWREHWRQTADQRRWDEESRRQAREKEQARRASEEKVRSDGNAQRARHDARAQCDAVYRLHAPEIRGRFSKADFDDFVAKYMNDSQAAEDVQRHAAQLRTIIEQHRERIAPPKNRMSLADLAQWFLSEKAQIDAAPLDGEDKKALVAQLEGRYAKLQEKHIRSIEP